MPYAPRPTTTFPSSSSTARLPSSNSCSSQQSSALASRIAAKKSELENLKQLRDLSGALAGQMGVLEEKLATLADGTEAVACVLANWHHVLRAINMASMKVPTTMTASGKDSHQQQAGQENMDESHLPVTLVRIPAKSQDPRRPHVEADAAPS